MDQNLNFSIFIISDLTVLLIVFNLKSGIVNLHSSQHTRNLVTGAVPVRVENIERTRTQETHSKAFWLIMIDSSG